MYILEWRREGKSTRSGEAGAQGSGGPASKALVAAEKGGATAAAAGKKTTQHTRTHTGAAAAAAAAGRTRRLAGVAPRLARPDGTSEEDEGELTLLKAAATPRLEVKGRVPLLLLFPPVFPSPWVNLHPTVPRQLRALLSLFFFSTTKRRVCAFCFCLGLRKGGKEEEEEGKGESSGRRKGALSLFLLH